MKDKLQPPNTLGEITAIPPEAVHLVSGLIVQVLKPGEGEERPGPEDTVQVVIEAWTEQREPVETSENESAAMTLSVNETSAGLAEALQLMTVGQIMRVWIPPHLASTRQDVAKETLIFDIELLGFTRVKDVPPLPVELTSPRQDE